MRRAWLASVVVGLLACGSGVAQDRPRYSIRLIEPGKGSTASTDVNLRNRFSVQKRDAAGQLVGDDLNIFGAQFASDFTYLEVGPKSSRLREHYKKYRVTVNGDTTVDPVEGKTFLVLEKDGKKEVLTAKGEPLLPEERQKLERASAQQPGCPTSYQELMPAAPVGVGDSWPIKNASAWVARDDAEATVTKAIGQLQKVYRKDGRLHGLIELRAEVSLKSITVQGRRLPLKAGSRIVMKSVVEGCIDGTSPARVEKCTCLATMVAQTTTPDGLDATMDQSMEVNTNKVWR